MILMVEVLTSSFKALNNLNQLVIDLNLDPKVLPTVGTEMITSKTNVIGIDFFHGGSAQVILNIFSK